MQFFFSSRRRHTRFIGDWSSDVCSSDLPRAWVLPTLTLALGPLGIVARFTRAAVLDVVRADFTLTARAKGLSEAPVIFKHVLKNAMIPVVTVLGPMFAAIGTGSFFVESIFRVPGLRSEERRVGKEWSSRVSRCRGKKWPSDV